MNSAAEIFAGMLGNVVKRQKPGPVAWCTVCHRKHPRRQHPETFRQVVRLTRAGYPRVVWAHEPLPKKQRKTRVRKS